MGEAIASALRRSGDEPERFMQFYDAHAEELLRFFARRVIEGESARDLLAESLAQAYKSRRRFRGRTDAEAAAWLYTIARRQLSRYWRKGALDTKAAARLGIHLSAADSEEIERIDDLAALAGLRDAVRAELPNLTAEHREALELRIVSELPYAEVARRLEVTEATARARVSRALRAMRKSLGDHYEAEGEPT